eukprot:4932702-Pyramimonas_sp.AAC.1
MRSNAKECQAMPGTAKQCQATAPSNATQCQAALCSALLCIAHTCFELLRKKGVNLFNPGVLHLCGRRSGPGQQKVARGERR